MGGFFAGKDMTCGDFERYNENVERNKLGRGGVIHFDRYS